MEVLDAGLYQMVASYAPVAVLHPTQLMMKIKAQKTMKLALELTVAGWIWEAIVTESIFVWFNGFCAVFGKPMGAWVLQILLAPTGKFVEFAWHGWPK